MSIFKATLVVLSAVVMLISISESAHSSTFVHAKLLSSESRVSPLSLMFQNSESTHSIYVKVQCHTACSVRMCSKQTGNNSTSAKPMHTKPWWKFFLGPSDSDLILEALRDLRVEQGKQGNQLEEQGKQLAAQGKQLLVISRKVGNLNEDNLRKQAESMFGVSFGKSFLARSLYDLVHLVTTSGQDSDIDSVNQRLVLSTVMARALLPSIPPLVRSLCSFMKCRPEVQTNSGTASLIKVAETEIQNNNMIKGVGLMINVAKQTGKNQWTKLLSVVKKGLSDDDDQEMVQKLCSCDGPGVLLANLMSQASFWKRSSNYAGADFVEKYLDTLADPFVEFSNEVEFDMRGSISLLKPFVTITLGEIKSSMLTSELQSAKQQLALRCWLLYWVVTTVYPGEFSSVVLIGRIFVPRQSGETDRSPEISPSGISYYIHRV